MFSNYPPSLDPKDTKYTVAELMPNNTERPYPSAEMNSPPGGSINYTTTPPVRREARPVVLVLANAFQDRSELSELSYRRAECGHRPERQTLDSGYRTSVYSGEVQRTSIIRRPETYRS